VGRSGPRPGPRRRWSRYERGTARAGSTCAAPFKAHHRPLSDRHKWTGRAHINCRYRSHEATRSVRSEDGQIRLGVSPDVENVPDGIMGAALGPDRHGSRSRPKRPELRPGRRHVREMAVQWIGSGHGVVGRSMAVTGNNTVVSVGTNPPNCARAGRRDRLGLETNGTTSSDVKIITLIPRGSEQPTMCAHDARRLVESGSSQATAATTTPCRTTTSRARALAGETTPATSTPGCEPPMVADE